ncbi:MAG: DUF421 domain-containing protein [Phenylobacterium sp.]|uniref:DUF421 domain-containing protein n=1 Tax=Phenylobacterium sp. TaxID=1871053 RepID=UPI002735B941|nr:YetF domain-containing protein [Phenylobacterium sp.]MDP1642229.1 DUF421 domain-containing protein [Phenylobacterium sp.]MDP3117117.1 DUF421 domain-containing protein [Phenylobacterium sp.]MDP3381884.1 DUF421 domain-containing protein [Phenylobacterium sp.]
MDFEALFTGWDPILRILVVGTAAYVALVVVLRVSGKRTLSKLNAFDLVVTVAIGSTFSSILTSKDLALAEGVAALALLVGLQYAVTLLSVRIKAIDKLVKSEPSLLLKDGAPLPGALRRQRVTQEELLAAIRTSGGAELSDAAFVVLESDGSLSAVLKG